MSTLQKQKGPAETAISPSRGSDIPQKGKPMNVQTDTRPVPRCKLTRKEFDDLTDALFTKANIVQRHLYLLMGVLEDSLNEKRGVVNGTTVTLKFQKRGIEVTTWLAGAAWSQSDDLVELSDKLLESFDYKGAAA